MHLSFLGEFWWALVLAMVLIMLVFVLIAGRKAEGGFKSRSRVGWSKWMAVSRKAAEVQARVILTIFYFSFAAPFGIARSMIGDPLRMRRSGQPTWLPRQTRDRTLDDARRQF